MSVLVVVTRREESDAFIRWGQIFAHAKKEDLIVLCPLESKEQGTSDLRLDEASEIPLLEAVRRNVVDLERPPVVRVLRGNKHLPAILEVVRELRGSLLILGETELQEDLKDDVSLQADLLKKAPADVLLLHSPAETGKKCARILLPTDGQGENLIVALQLAEVLSSNDQVQIDVAYVNKEMGEEAEIIAYRILNKAMCDAGVEENESFEQSVIEAPQVVDGIIDAIQLQSYDLILFGASNLHFIRRKIFGSIRDQIAKMEQPPAVGVLQSAAPITTRTRAHFLSFLENTVPQLERAERIELSRHLEGGSSAGFNFISLICLSTAIAALGLIQNSGAVVIGAMLVAPLMTPMLGAGLALVQGNIFLLKTAVRSVITGFLYSLGVGFLFGLLIPKLNFLTPELLARGEPNILDLVVALLSGVAAAFALARPGLLEALPGVAIAAALVPPIATVGISFALGEMTNARGAATLFGTNLVAIILASSLTFYSLGIRPRLEEDKAKPWARHLMLILLGLVFLIAIPLWKFFGNSTTMQERWIEQKLKGHFHRSNTIIRNITLSRKNGRLLAVVELIHPGQIAPPVLSKISKIVSDITGPETLTRVYSLRFWQASYTSQPRSRPLTRRRTHPEPTRNPTPQSPSTKPAR